jgi:hypothetical protein
LPKPRANVYSFPDNVCNLNNLPISDEIAVQHRGAAAAVVPILQNPTVPPIPLTQTAFGWQLPMFPTVGHI